ncbi:MAG: hypothetical protein LQ339_005337 [Xanthoria mediterranea]|nr:MAG: hypothetical protein LQ339_005337 [Xanthoria mediterranea]
MTKKKSQRLQDPTIEPTIKASQPPESSTQFALPSTTSHNPSTHKVSKIADSPPTSALIICRNKHWRYISSFHGPWLQLPPEVLESLAYSNYALPSPRPIDPAVFFDLVKIRRAVEEATDLAVRATSGTPSSHVVAAMKGSGNFRGSLHASNGMLGGGGGAAALGFGFGGTSHAKLSKERRHRMRESATQKLSQAYHLDEIAASVATMQSASSLEEVAQLVLQRNPNDSDAKYVHFFHEKIPSRMLAESTSLEPLDEIIRNRRTDSSFLRTRAVTRIFKNDLAAAAEDLTEALAITRFVAAQHKAGRGQMELSNIPGGTEEKTGGPRDWRHVPRLEDESQPSSLESQLLFHRASVYLAMACQSITTSLEQAPSNADPIHGHEPTNPKAESRAAPPSMPAPKRALEARKLVKTYAKRALRDFVNFLSFFEYSPGMSADLAEAYVRQLDATASDAKRTQPAPGRTPFKETYKSAMDDFRVSGAITPYLSGSRHWQNNGTASPSYPELPPLKVYPISDLFASSPPADLVPYPVPSRELVKVAPKRKTNNLDGSLEHDSSFSGCDEAVTYHPLLTEALHSLLLCHTLVQTSSKEHLRHAHMVARLARQCDGYPVFLAARSPSRADWIEIVRRADNWIGLEQSWESLCAPAPLPGQPEEAQEQRTPEQKRERRRQQAIEDSLSDENVHDEATFQAAVAARERLAEKLVDDQSNQTGSGPQRWAQADGKEYPIVTERATAIARWVKEAPLNGPGSGKPKHKAKEEKGGKKLK